MMFVRLLTLLIVLGIVHSNYANSDGIVGGWQTSGKGCSRSKVLKLARQQLNSTNLASEPIEILSLETQVVAGTNYRLIFVVGEQQQCTLIAFKPLPYTKKPIEVTSFTCNNITSVDNVTTNNE
jgi:hypothetical protein